MSDGPPPTDFPSSTEPFSTTLATPHGTSRDTTVRRPTQPQVNGASRDNKNENLQKLNRWLVTGGRAGCPVTVDLPFCQ